MNKDKIRKQVLKARLNQPDEAAAEKSRAITRRILDLPEYRRALCLMVYISFRKEADTGEIIRLSLSGGKKVLAPVVEVQGCRIVPCSLEVYPQDLVEGPWGLREPGSGRPADPGEIDLVLVPGVAFDIRGYRIGYGKGYYDRFLPRTRQGVVFVAPAFELQLVEDVFHGPHDIPVHMVVTEQRTIRI